MKKIIPLITIIFLAISLRWAIATPVKEVKGEVAFLPEGIDLAVNLGDKGSLKISIKKLSLDQYSFKLWVEHLSFSIYDFSSEIEGFLQVNQSDKQIVGEISSKYSLINYQPIKELQGKFRIYNNRLLIDFFSFGNIACRGYIDVIDPYKLDLVIDLSSVGMDDFLSFWMPEKTFDSSGEVFGQIKASGEVNQLALSGKLVGYDGFIKNLKYATIHLSVEGIYPKMVIGDSPIHEETGRCSSVSGLFDLSDKGNFKKQIKALLISPCIKDSTSELEWTIKSLKKRDTTTEFKYLLREEEGVGSHQQNKSDMLGIERKIEF